MSVFLKKKITQENVYELGLARIRRAYELFDHVAVSFSGGKDSTVCLHLALEVAKEIGRFPLDVFFFDEEAIHPETIDYVRRVGQRDDVRLRWFCLPVMGVLTVIDADALTNYCDTWSRWKKAVVFIQKNGDVYVQKDESGTIKYIQQLPQVAIARNLLAVLNRYQQEFGLTPAARSRLTVAEQDSSPGLVEFLGIGVA